MLSNELLNTVIKSNRSFDPGYCKKTGEFEGQVISAKFIPGDKVTTTNYTPLGLLIKVPGQQTFSKVININHDNTENGDQMSAFMRSVYYAYTVMRDINKQNGVTTPFFNQLGTPAKVFEEFAKLEGKTVKFKQSLNQNGYTEIEIINQ